MKSLAIIGTGIAGLGCAHFLHGRYDLSLYEQNDYTGGHTNTITVDEAGRAVPIDTGFMVFNHQTYPNLTRLFRELDVETKKTEMSFSVQHAPSGLEYNGGSLSLLFGQRRNLLNIRHGCLPDRYLVCHSAVRPVHFGLARYVNLSDTCSQAIGLFN